MGRLDESTQGVVTIYGADWCGPCLELENRIAESGLDTRLAAEGIVFRYVKNQHEEGDPGRPRINEHVRWDADPRGVPAIFIDDLGRSGEDDRAELAASHVRRFRNLENYIRRFALDERVSMLDESDAVCVLEAIASGRFIGSLRRLDELRLGFQLMPIDVEDPRSLQDAARLQAVGEAVQILDVYFLEQRSSEQPPADLDAARARQQSVESRLTGPASAAGARLREYYERGPICFPAELAGTASGTYYRALAERTGRAFVLERRVPSADEVRRAVRPVGGTGKHAETELASLLDHRQNLEEFYRALALHDVWYVPENALGELPEGGLVVEGRAGSRNRVELLASASKGQVIWVQAPVAAAGPYLQCAGEVAARFWPEIRSLKEVR